MSLRPPVLDDRRFDALVRDARDRLVQRFPEWTDFGPSDPGMALVDLFAWYTETLLHQMAQLPALHYFEFLELLGMAPTPPAPSRAAVRFRLPKEASAPIVVPAGTPSLTLAGPDGSRIGFQTTRELGVVARPLVRLVRDLPTTPEDAEPAGDLAALAAPDGPGFHPFGRLGEVGSTLYLGFQATSGNAASDVFPEVLSLYLRPVDETAAPPATAEIAGETPAPAPAGGVYPLPAIAAFAVVGERETEPLDILAESDAAGFDRAGYIHLRGPRRARPRPWPDARADDEAAPCLWIGLRVTGASFPYDRAPMIRLLTDAVEAVAQETVVFREVGVSTGLADQRFTLRDTPVEPASLQLVVVDDPGPSGDLRAMADRAEPWRVVDDFAHSGSRDEHVVVDATTGELRFGDSVTGAIPHAGRRIIARRYRRGGGAVTNVAADKVRFEPFRGVVGTNPFAAEGGRDAEAAEARAARAPRRLRDLGRIVTPEDAGSIARDLGGMARAKAERGHHPDYPHAHLPGALTVVVAPPITPRRRHPPYPDRAAVDHLVGVLEARRLLGQELFVRPAAVVPVKVHAVVQAEPGIPPREVVADALARLDAVINDAERGFGGELHPLTLAGELQALETIRRVRRLAYRLGDHEEIVTTGHVPRDEAKPGDEVLPRIADDAIFWSRPDHAITVEGTAK